VKLSHKKSVAILFVALIGVGFGIILSPTSKESIVFAKEPTGGRWMPLVLNSSDALRVPAPPSRNSQQFNQEINELRALQSNQTAQVNESISYWNASASVRWNEIARSLVMKYNTTPPMASRVYALLSVAQYDTLVATWNNKYTYNRSSPHEIDNTIKPLIATSADPSYPSDQAAVAATSAEVLSYLYPKEAVWLSKQAANHEASQLWAGVSFRSDVVAGMNLGNTVARDVINRAKNDGSNAFWNGTVPTRPGKWFSSESPPKPPLLPLWGEVKPWLLNKSDEAELMPPPPPVYNSQQFNQSLKEVKQISDNRTAKQLQIAQFWADGAGTVTPPGHWNQIACDLISNYHLNELRSARTLALMNAAMMDTGIHCWNCKYTYWYIRPSQADPTITTPVGLPNFPSYVSGHSSFSGAAGEVLSYIFPTERSELQAKVQEASLSRLYAGIHYRFDCDQGLKVGRGVAQHAIQHGMNDGSPP